MKPFFSIVLPTYNRASTLIKCVESVISQTFREFELLIMDDGSDDGTENLIAGLDDPRIYYEFGVNSGGPATPRNRGIKAAQGKWICFIDSDDTWHPEKLSVVYRLIHLNREIDVFCHNEYIFNMRTRTKSISKYGPYETDFYRQLLTKGNRLSTSAVTVNRNFLVKHNLQFNQSNNYVIVEDYDLWLKIACSGGKFFFIETPLGEYSINQDNISLNKTQFFINLTYLLRDHVFKIQMFEQNRDRLWKQVRLQLIKEEAKDAIEKCRYLAVVQQLASGFIGAPILCMTLLSDWIRRKFGMFRKTLEM